MINHKLLSRWYNLYLSSFLTIKHLEPLFFGELPHQRRQIFTLAGENVRYYLFLAFHQLGWESKLHNTVSFSLSLFFFFFFGVFVCVCVSHFKFTWNRLRVSSATCKKPWIGYPETIILSLKMWGNYLFLLITESSFLIMKPEKWGNGSSQYSLT